MSEWLDFDLDKSVRDYEYTRRAAVQMNRIIDSGDFEEMDADMIFAYLQGKMQLVSFRDFLRRYLYSAAQIKEPFYTVDDDVYREIIMNSFEESYTPHSVEPTTKKWSAIVKGWLSSDSVRRSTVFLIGFGLRMSESEVSEFLTKVIKEEDFHPALFSLFVIRRESSGAHGPDIVNRLPASGKDSVFPYDKQRRAVLASTCEHSTRPARKVSFF